MLNILLSKIQSIVNIKNIIDENSIITIKYFDGEENQPSESQLLQINELISQWPLEKTKLEKIQLLDDNWKIKVKTGWQTPDGYSLGIDISDVALLNGAFSLAKEASIMGINDPINIVDTNGQSHSMNLQDLTVLMLQYGQARASLSNSYANIKQSINSASSIEELEAININL